VVEKSVDDVREQHAVPEQCMVLEQSIAPVYSIVLVHNMLVSLRAARLREERDTHGVYAVLLQELMQFLPPMRT